MRNAWDYSVALTGTVLSPKFGNPERRNPLPLLLPRFQAGFYSHNNGFRGQLKIQSEETHLVNLLLNILNDEASELFLG